MKFVKVTYKFGDFLKRQTPRKSGIWGNYQFVFDDSFKKADFWIILNNYKLKNESCVCNKSNILFINQEPNSVSRFHNDNYDHRFLSQFGIVITSNQNLQGENILYHQPMLPWFFDKSYEELVYMESINKTKIISIITSDKAFTPGHRKRIICAKALKSHFKDKLDFYGRGFKSFEDKWNTLAPYKFHIAIENLSERHYFTEKLIDPFLAYSLPLYYGCSNINEYLNLPQFLVLENLEDFKEICNRIEFLIDTNDLYLNNLNCIRLTRNKILNELQFFPAITSILDKMNVNAPKSNQVINYFPPKKRSLFYYQNLIQRKIFNNRYKI